MFANVSSNGNAPAMALCGVPLVVQQTQPINRLVHQADYDCQHATWLMIEPISGLAPPRWQSFVGPVIVYRPGGQDLGLDDMDLLIEFVSGVLEHYDAGELAPQRFQEYKRWLIEYRQAGPGGSRLDDLHL